ncbi:hypothetical protein DYB37_009599 [Aphanomyces astaci]|uniref:Helicase-associated domain-containing protein n=2 Tax=Aphanomyces astaci TaxID=112090 RepID=A0A418EYG6_APHAT|nr:hypothetical protein DYB37_009599 [Aphanomyces astaci]
MAIDHRVAGAGGVEVIELLSSSSDDEDKCAAPAHSMGMPVEVVSLSSSSSSSSGDESPQPYHRNKSHQAYYLRAPLSQQHPTSTKRQAEVKDPYSFLGPPTIRSHRRRRLTPTSTSPPQPSHEQLSPPTVTPSFNLSPPSSPSSPLSPTLLHASPDLVVSSQQPTPDETTSPPPPSIPLSNDPEARFVQVVQVAYSIQRHISDYTYLAPTFTIPRQHPWPLAWAGTVVNVSACREAYRHGQLHSHTVAKAATCHFVWDDDEAALQWKVHLAALYAYKAKYGNLAVPPSFQVPPCNTHTTEMLPPPPELDTIWPKDASSLPLGRLAQALRAAPRGSLSQSQRDQLDHIGFLWDEHQVTWTNRLIALKTFKHVHGHMHVPTLFVVPDDDSQWPTPTHGLPLGWIVASLRQNKRTLLPEQVQLLTALGFVFTPPQYHLGLARKSLPHTLPKTYPRNLVADPRVPVAKTITAHSPKRADVFTYCNVDADMYYLGAYATARFPMFGAKALPPTVQWTDYGEVYI